MTATLYFTVVLCIIWLWCVFKWSCYLDVYSLKQKRKQKRSRLLQWI